MNIADKIIPISNTLKKILRYIPKVYNRGYSEGYELGDFHGRKSQYDEFWDAYQLKGDRRSYKYSFAECGWNKETFKPKYKIIIGGSGEAWRVDAMFYRFNSQASEPLDYRDYMDMIDLTGIKSASSLFDGARFNYIDVDLSSCTTLINCFSCGMNQTYCTDISVKVSEACTAYSGAFSQCSYLKNLEFKEGSIIAANIGFAQSSLLTHDSLISIINALKDYSGTSTTRTLTLHATAKARLEGTNEGLAAIAEANRKGWSL